MKFGGSQMLSSGTIQTILYNCISKNENSLYELYICKILGKVTALLNFSVFYTQYKLSGNSALANSRKLQFKCVCLSDNDTIHL